MERRSSFVSFPERTSPELGPAVRELRLRRGWSLEELARELDTLVYRVQSWGAGDRAPQNRFWTQLRDLWNEIAMQPKDAEKNDSCTKALTITEAKAGLSLGLGVPEDAIEITVRA